MFVFGTPEKGVLFDSIPRETILFIRIVADFRGRAGTR